MSKELMEAIKVSADKPGGKEQFIIIRDSEGLRARLQTAADNANKKSKGHTMSSLARQGIRGVCELYGA